MLMLDPHRRAEQMAYVEARVETVYEVGDMIWAAVTEQQIDRFIAQGISVQLQPEAGLIELPAVEFDPVEGVPLPAADLRIAPPTAEETAYYIVQFAAPLGESGIAEIEELEGIYVQEVPEYGLIFQLTAGQAAEVMGLPWVSWVGLYHPGYALDYDLMGREAPYSVGELQHQARDLARADLNKPFIVGSFDDVDPESLRQTLATTGTALQENSRQALIVIATAEQLLAIAKIPGVQSIELYQAPILGNQRAGVIVGVDHVRSSGNVDFLVNLDGQGEIVGVIDSGIDHDHPDFSQLGAASATSRIVYRWNLHDAPGALISNSAEDTPPIQNLSELRVENNRVIIPNTGGPHGTHVTGTIVGNGSHAVQDAVATHTSQPKGIAPAAHVVFHAVRDPNYVLTGEIDFTNFLEAFLEAHQRGARVHNNSWGGVSFGNSSRNAYTQSVSGLIDRFTFFYSESVVVFGAGNSEDDRNRNGVLDRNRLSQEVVAKNILAVGASENVTKTDGVNQTYRQLLSKRRLGHSNFDAIADAPPTAGDFPISDNADQVALFSCRGRVRGTRRVRPDLVAPGTNVLSVRPHDDRTGAPMALKRPATVVTADGNQYYMSSGTSMAAPMVSGAALLTRQYYRSQFTQLRRPVLLEQVSQLVMQQVAIAPHINGVAIAWLQTENNNFHLVGAVYSNTIRQRGDTVLARQGPIQPLQANVGDHPAPALAHHGDHTLLLYRASDNSLHLERYTTDLIGDGNFGTGGEVVLSPASRPELERSPSLLVHGDTIAVLWHGTSGDSLQFQRFQAATGAAIGGAQVLGNATQTSVHPALIHTGQQYAVAWVNQSGNSYSLQAIRVDNNGAVVGAAVTLLSQTQEIRHPHMVWNPHNRTFYLVWVTVANGSDTLQGLCTQPDFTPIGAVHPIAIPVAPAANGPSTRPPQGIRHPRLAAHPSQGLVLTWEDNTQLVWIEDDARPVPQDDEWHPRYDSYLAFLNNAGLPRSPRLRISDTPENTQGFTALTQSGGTVVTWLSNDEINSDQLGIYAVKVNEQGAFQSQVSPYTPLLNSGRYQAHSLGEFPVTTVPAAVAMAWSGGTYFLLRGNVQSQLQLIHTNGDGLPDGPLSPVEAQSLAFDNSQDVALDWAGSHLVIAHSTALQVQVGLLNNLGTLETRFGTQGLHPLAEPPLASIAPQVATLGSGRRLRILVVYGISGDSQGQLRYTVLDHRGNAITRLRDLDAADGTARQGWFHYVPSERRSIAIWQVQSSDRTVVQLNRYRLNGRAARRTPIQLTDLPGSSRNAVVAPRPVLFGMGLVKRTQGDRIRWRAVSQAAQKRRQREYGVAWEYQASAATPSEIRFSRLERDGDVTSTKDVVVVAGDQPASEPQLVWHGDGYGLAWLQPETDNGPRRLFFTIIDENGIKVNLAATDAAAPMPAANHTVSGVGDVQRFHLIWNGRSFRITWTERRTERSNGTIQHFQRALSLPRSASDTSYDHPFQQPSAALIRATLVNGATNLRCTALPNLSNHPLDGYGWGRLNLRQSLSPSPPVTFHVRDDNAVASGSTVTYQFSLPMSTRLLRVTLAWTDPPGRRVVNNLNLRLTTPTAGITPAQVYVGNRFQTAGELDPTSPCRDRTGNPAPAQFSAPLPSRPPRNPFQTDHTVEQIVIPNPPAGVYQVDVIGGTFRPSALQQFPGQPFALVFVGSGEEVRFGNALPTNLPFF